MNKRDLRDYAFGAAFAAAAAPLGLVLPFVVWRVAGVEWPDGIGDQERKLLLIANVVAFAIAGFVVGHARGRYQPKSQLRRTVWHEVFPDPDSVPLDLARGTIFELYPQGLPLFPRGPFVRSLPARYGGAIAGALAIVATCAVGDTGFAVDAARREVVLRPAIAAWLVGPVVVVPVAWIFGTILAWMLFRRKSVSGGTDP